VVNSLWVNGERIVQDGQITTLDVNALRQELFDRSQWQILQDTPSRDRMEPQYRRVMKLSS
jgi:hypothetical protein